MSISANSSPEQYSDLTPVEEYVAALFVSHKSTEASADNAMPSGLIHYVKLLLHHFCDIIKNSFLFKSMFAAINCVLLHSLVHVCMLYYCDGSIGLMTWF